MSKIICDVCGTSYPDTTTQCPICGCVRSADVEAVVAGEEATETVVGSTYTYVKGGRFSKANVKKRNSGKPVVTTTAPAPKAAQTKPATTTKASDTGKADLPEKISNDNSGKKSNIGLIIVIVILSLAIVAVLSYIAVRYIAPIVLGENAGNNISEYVPVPDNETDAATDPVNPDVSCTGITLSDVEVFLISAGDSYMLTVTAEPTNTTDEILFASDDEAIATVDENGVITAVAAGETIVTVTCGSETELCRVVCEFAGEGVDGELVLVADTYTLSQKGETWTCYTGAIPAEDITWTSDNEAVATVSNGVVTAVGVGTTTIRAQYNEAEVTCEIICEESVNSETEGTAGENQNSATTGNFKFNTSDPNEMMLSVGESFGLQLRDENRKALSGVKFTSSNSNICSVTENGTVKGVAYGNATIDAEYNGVIYKCKVYVR